MFTLQHPRIRFLTICFLAALVICACSPAASPAPFAEQSVESGATPPMIAEEAARDAASGFGGGTVNLQVERLVIKNASLNLVVADPGESMDRIGSLAEEMGGFIVSANLYKTQLESGVEVPRASITIRIPAEKLEDAMAQIEGESDLPPLRKDINSQDITSEYTDLQSRLRNLEDAEAQLREIMASASRTEDVLQVYNQLTSVREQIEVLKGQIQFYDQAVALSSISVELLPNEAVQPLTIGGWQPVGVARNAIQALINTLKFLLNAAIWIVLYLLPTLLVIFLIFGLPVILFFRWLRRLRQPSKKPSPPVVPPASNPPAS
jgi:hypothetical protein